MNIMLVTPWRPSLTGGVSTVVARLAGEFKKKGHEVTIFVADRANRLEQIESLDNTAVYGMYLRSPTSPEYPVRAVLMCCMWFPVTMLQLIILARRKRLDAVIIQYPLPSMFYFGVLKSMGGCKLAITYQGNDAHDLSLWTSRDRQLVKFLLEKADIVLAVSRSLLEKVKKVLPDLRLLRSGLLPNGAPLDAIVAVEGIRPPASLPPDYILTAGHLIHRKGIDIIIAALGMAKNQGMNLHLVVAGDGPERESLIRLACKHGVSDQIVFLGNQSHQEVLVLMKSCLLFVLASRAEGMPLVIAEAMACGKAVIGTNVDGVPEIVQDGKTGILVPPEDPQSLTAALIRVYSNQPYRDSLSKQGQEWALREYNWAAIAMRYLSLIEECKVR
jgi:glycosyltransferase involved in cell wall biosynthesis